MADRTEELWSGTRVRELVDGRWRRGRVVEVLPANDENEPLPARVVYETVHGERYSVPVTSLRFWHEGWVPVCE